MQIILSENQFEVRNSFKLRIKIQKEKIFFVALIKIQISWIFIGKTPRRFHRLTHDRNKIWYYTYIREQY